MSTPITLRNQKLGVKVVQALKNRFFEAWYFDEQDDAIEKIVSLIPADHTASWGGSFTLDEIGIKNFNHEPTQTNKNKKNGGLQVCERTEGSSSYWFVVK
jgi:hypothetical protein